MMTNGKVHEECAVFGVCLTAEEAAGVTYNGLLTLQHRGQQGAGIAVINGGKILCHKNTGLVTEVFSARELERMPQGRVAIGHTRYSKTGRNTRENVGPAVTEYLTGRIAVAHNGGLENAQALRDNLSKVGLLFHSASDDEVISSYIAYCITRENNIVNGIIKAAGYLQGAFSLVVATGENQLVAVRDPNGFRPLCIGENEYGLAVASESCALEVCGFGNIRDLCPGEVVVMENGKVAAQGSLLTNRGLGNHHNRGLCIFEYVYFARPDSVVDGLSVYQARHNMGSVLAEEHPVEADIVCGVPDSGLDAAHGFADRSGIPLALGLMMNRYVGRSFIYPTQTQRESVVRLKLNPLTANIRDKRVVLVDDSIVRGTTTANIVNSLKKAGAREVHVRISSPPFRYTCHYGTDIDSEENLIINRMDMDAIRQKIGADSLGYISIEGLKRACSQCKLPFCTACFTGN